MGKNSVWLFNLVTHPLFSKARGQSMGQHGTRVIDTTTRQELTLGTPNLAAVLP
jgi:hypothetical protein